MDESLRQIAQTLNEIKDSIGSNQGAGLNILFLFIGAFIASGVSFFFDAMRRRGKLHFSIDRSKIDFHHGEYKDGVYVEKRNMDIAEDWTTVTISFTLDITNSSAKPKILIIQSIQYETNGSDFFTPLQRQYWKLVNHRQVREPLGVTTIDPHCGLRLELETSIDREKWDEHKLSKDSRFVLVFKDHKHNPQRIRLSRIGNFIDYVDPLNG